MIPDLIVEQLRKAGYRMTRPRRRILSAVWQFDGHFTVDRLHVALASEGEAVDLSTIYRTLELMTELDVVHPLHGTLPTEYERVQHEAHHHLICESCGTTTELTDIHLDTLYRHLLEEHKFVARLAHLAIPGTCEVCLPPDGESE